MDNLCKVLKQRIGLLRRIKYKVNKDKLQIIAEAIFTSKIRYGIAVYSSPRLEEDEAENSDIQKIQVLQNDMLRLINGHTRAEQVNMKSLREELMTLSVNQLACYPHFDGTVKVFFEEVEDDSWIFGLEVPSSVECHQLPHHLDKSHTSASRP